VFGHSYKLFKLFGFEVKVDASWLILAVLVTWSLAEGVFPYYFHGLSRNTYWLMGVAGVIGLLLSIVIHEFSHSLVARRFGMPIRGISLFIFGGVAEMTEEPPSAKSEFLMAVVGPATSLVLAVLLYQFYAAATALGWPEQVAGVAYYLAYLNAILAVFNLVPAFPLDGGRMLRAVLWGWRRDLKTATRLAARIGSGFGIALMIGGVYVILNGYIIGGVWWILIGLFLRNAAQVSYSQMLMREKVSGKTVADLMNDRPVTITPSTTVRDWVEHYVYKYHHKLFPVVEAGKLAGCVTTSQLRELEKAEWDRHTVGELVQVCSAQNTVAPDMDAVRALSLMSQSGSSRLMVVANGRLQGILTLKDLMNYLSFSSEYEP
jgi:Zn-dependent protease/CBS domain-containing protein